MDITTVSYTHLDVYKRQQQSNTQDQRPYPPSSTVFSPKKTLRQQTVRGLSLIHILPDHRTGGGTVCHAAARQMRQNRENEMDTLEKQIAFIRQAERLKSVTREAWTSDGRRELSLIHI